MTEIRLDLDLAHPPARVWRAVSDRRELGEWFLPAEADPAGPGRIRFQPVRAAGLTGPFQAEVIEEEPPSRLVMRWYAEDLHVRVNITIEPTPGGCRLTFVQRGFLGPKGTLRRRVLRGTYGRLFGERLPAYLDRAPVPVGGDRSQPAARRNDGGFRTLRVPEPASASRVGRAYGSAAHPVPAEPAGQVEPISPAPVSGAGGVEPVSPAATPEPVRGRAAVPAVGPYRPHRRWDRLRPGRRHRVRRRPSRPPAGAPAHPLVREAGAWLRAIPGWTAERRSRAVAVSAILLLLIALVMVIVARITVYSLAEPPQVGGGDDRSPGFTVVPGEPGTSGGTARAGGSSAGVGHSGAAGTGAPATVAAASPLTGAYHTASTWVGGYRGEVRITNPATGPVRGWTAVVTLPLLGLAVQDVHGAQFRQSGKTVTFRPVDATGTVEPGASVSFDFAVNGVGAPTGCTVDGHPCAGLAG